jgi:4-hydroxythreonine-4-phosphate dehydrogenase
MGTPLPSIAISLGDPAGIGPEVTIKALADPELREAAHWVVVGEDWIVEELEEQIGRFPRQIVHRLEEADQKTNCIFWSTGSLEQSQRALGKVSPGCGRAALEYVRLATELCLSGATQAMVTAPLNKEAVVLSGQEFCGHTEYIAQLCGVGESRMLLVNDRLSVVHVTTHISMIDATRLTKSRITTTLKLAAEAYERLRAKRPRIAVCGLNPHAGENGLFGSEEADTIVPAIATARAEGIDCVGPLPADTLFLQAFRGAYDLVVAMYHDQGHIPMKLMDFDHTVNVTLGLPIVRTSVDHGTAFDIAGKNMASAEDMKTAMRMAIQLSAARDCCNASPL